MSSAEAVIALIGSLYEIGNRLRAKYFGPGDAGDRDGFSQERRAAAPSVLDQIAAWLEAKTAEVPSQTVVGKAISYTREQWPRLVCYVECPYLTPDNNEAERAIRLSRSAGRFGFFSEALTEPSAARRSIR